MLSRKQRSLNQENQVAAALRIVYGDAHVQPGSGNQPGKPNDVRVPGEAYVECKETKAAQIIVSFAWLERIRSLSMPLRGYLAIKFSKLSNTNFYVVEDVVFEHLLKCELELRTVYAAKVKK